MTDPVRSSRWQIARPAVSTRFLLDTACAHGLSETACLDGTGLRASDLDDPRAVVLPEQEMRVIRNLLAGGGDPLELGLDAGLRYSLTSTGILGYALLSSPTVREAISILARFATLTSAFFDVLFVETAAGMLVEIGNGDVPADTRAFLLTRDLVAGFRMATLLLTPEALTMIAALDHPVRLEVRDEISTRYGEYARGLVAPFGVTLDIRFGAHRNAFTIPSGILDRPTPAPAPQTAALCIEQCEQLLDQRRRFTGAAAQVRHLLLRNPAAMPTLAAAARELGLSERTLHRRLADSHTTFRTLVGQVREALATELLTEGLTVESVARHLGYSDTAAFTHAYRRWRGHPPSHRP
ncbi:MAG: AraC family transcriptional regulator [Nocardia sp.]|uniref:AraC family transcriptional regulator n=1 Tax=Nocardia sp. TaxID=1821 RepID=UPI002625E8DD|nr:AraC family transcriptional regulator [Nocardia sp.]MCU1640215.1 AraC family transcriptional regulator [Nocardia sp.]